MEHDHFFPPQDGISLGALASGINAELIDSSKADIIVRAVAPVYRAGAGDLCYMLTRRNRDELKTCQASAIICPPELRSLIPDHIPVLVSAQAHAAFALAGAMLFPEALRPRLSSKSASGIHPTAFVDPTARLEADVVIDANAVIGEDVEIGSGSRIGAGSVIGRGVRIGRNTTIATGCSIQSALIGDSVIIFDGARIGQDGFGYAPGPRGMLKIVQIGRVIIQDRVEVGANTSIDRGTMDDTVIGEGTKIDNLVQIGHNVRIGRHCGIVAQVGIAGSTVIGDGVMIGGASGVNGHITIGDGAQVAAMSGVMASLEPGEKVAGLPARPLKDFLRDVAQTMGQSDRAKSKGKDEK